MKKILFLFVCSFILSMTLSAQQGNMPTPEESAKRTTQMMKDSLNLSKQQIAPVDSINLVYSKAMSKLFQDANGDFSNIREDMQKLGATRDKALEKFLTDEQLQAFKKMMERRMRNFGNR